MLHVDEKQTVESGFIEKQQDANLQLELSDVRFAIH